MNLIGRVFFSSSFSSYEGRFSSRAASTDVWDQSSRICPRDAGIWHPAKDMWKIPRRREQFVTFLVLSLLEYELVFHFSAYPWIPNQHPIGKWNCVTVSQFENSKRPFNKSFPIFHTCCCCSVCVEFISIKCLFVYPWERENSQRIWQQCWEKGKGLDLVPISSPTKKMMPFLGPLSRPLIPLVE